MEQNAYPDRLDLRDQHLRMAKAKGVKFIVNTDAHHTSHMEKIRYGVLQLRRAWLTKQDVLNTLPAAEFARAIRRGRAVLATSDARRRLRMNPRMKIQLIPPAERYRESFLRGLREFGVGNGWQLQGLIKIGAGPSYFPAQK